MRVSTINLRDTTELGVNYNDDYNNIEKARKDLELHLSSMITSSYDEKISLTGSVLLPNAFDDFGNILLPTALFARNGEIEGLFVSHLFNFPEFIVKDGNKFCNDDIALYYCKEAASAVSMDLLLDDISFLEKVKTNLLKSVKSFTVLLEHNTYSVYLKRFITTPYILFSTLNYNKNGVRA